MSTERARRNFKRPPAPLDERPTETLTAKRCPGCGETKPHIEFSKHRGRRDGLQTYCKACDPQRRRNPEKANARSRAYYARNREAIRKKARERARARQVLDPEKVRAHRRAYYARNREKVIERQRARYLCNPNRSPQGPLAGQDTVEYAQILSSDPCAYCGGSMEHIDHINPLTQGGAADWTNLTASCAHCNLRKGTRPLLDFLGGAK